MAPPNYRSPWPWSRRTDIFDPPTLLDTILDSPLRGLMSIIYSILLYLRGPPFKPPPNKPLIKVVCISDTHTNIISVPNGDVLIHAGDLTNAGTVKDIQAQLDWLASLPHKEKIIICGNHDDYFDPKYRKEDDKGKKLNFSNIHYLEHKAITLKFKGGRKLNFYGAPSTPIIGDKSSAFQFQPESAPWGNRIPLETDVLITHGPPRHHLDLGLGDTALLEEIWLVKPRLHVCGHIHSGHSRQALFWDETQAAYERLMGRTRCGILGDILPGMAWWDSLKVLWFGMKGILWQRLMVGSRGGNGSLLVNAAIVWQSTTNVGNPPEIVEL